MELRGHVRTLDENTFFEVVLAKIDEKEDNYQASKEDRNSENGRAKAGLPGATTGGMEDPTSASTTTISPEEEGAGKQAASGEASNFSGRVEYNGSWRKRPDDSGPTDRKIEYRMGNRQRLNCVATTVAGPTPLSGELVLSLKGLSGKDRSIVAHAMDWASNEYDAILGTDAFRCVKGSVQIRVYDWVVCLGTKRYRSDSGVSHSRSQSHWVVPKPPDAQGHLHHRVVVDYKELNEHTRLEKYPLPRLEDRLYLMNGASVFSILDLKVGYH
ncbi:hypothetical protein AAG570_005307 [Ranatra chinensis]|uniref:Uncharacterized protein n=1 Tax=Ranatra chinensis TaxID=642074 RepID=A0ABD0Y028_9HEMI